MSQQEDEYAEEIEQVLGSIFDMLGLECPIQELDQLREPEIYFDIYKTIYPAYINPLRKILAAQLPDASKIQSLIDMLAEQVDDDTSHIRGDEIAAGNLQHILNLLQIFQLLVKELLRQQQNQEGGVKMVSDRFDSENNNNNNNHNGQPESSGREAIPQPPEKSSLDFQAKKVKKPGVNKAQSQSKAGESSSAGEELTGRNQRLRDDVTRTIREVKKKLSKTGNVDNRKSKNDDVCMMKTRYKNYLQEFIRDKKLEKRREQQKSVNRSKKSKTFAHPPQKEVLGMQLEQKALQMRIRDNKANYLKRIYKVVENLEKEKLIEENRLQRVFEKELDKATKNQIDSINSQHTRNMGVLKENLKGIKDNFEAFNVDHRRLVRQIEKEFKLQYLEEREKAKNILRQENDRLVAVLKDTDSLEQKIIDIYKKF